MEQQYGSDFGGMIWFIVIVILLVALWKTFEKAKRPGWNAIIPFYNIYVLLGIVKKPGWWLILYFIPFVNIIVHLVVALRLSKAFKRSDAFGIICLWLFPIIGFIVLGFSESKYTKPTK